MNKKLNRTRNEKQKIIQKRYANMNAKSEIESDQELIRICIKNRQKFRTQLENEPNIKSESDSESETHSESES